MLPDIFRPIDTARLEWHEDEPEAPAFADSYFSRDNGLAETRHVFINGNRLTERFATLTRGDCFVVGETGFGTGLNFLACAAAFLESAPAQSRLHFFSVEKFPLRHDDLALALQRWPALRELADALLHHYPDPVPGFHRRIFCDGRIHLTLALGDASDMLAQWRAPVDAWFLDGFAPSRNPDMWHPALFDRIAALSHANTTLATFTSAGFVRRGLDDAGFVMQRVPGFGRKREMLTGARRGDAAARQHRAAPERVAVVGAGLAGCTTAAALAERGLRVSLFDPLGVANAASGNLAGVVYTTPSAHMTAQNRFYQHSYLFALHSFSRHGFPRTDDDGALSGVIQQPRDSRQAQKQQDALASGYWPATLARPADNSPAGTLLLPRGGYLSPGNWCRHLLARHQLDVTRQQVRALHRTSSGWRLAFADGTLSDDFDHVILANAGAAASLVALPWLALKQIRGQVSQVAATGASRDWRQAHCHAGYLTPPIAGQHCVGATFDLHDDTAAPRAEDDQRNLDQLREHLPGHWLQLGGEQARVQAHRVGFRCQSTDFLPLCGALADVEEGLAGVWLNIAHGSRGISGTTLCAELLACALLDEPLPVDAEMHAALAPVRFLRRRRHGQRRDREPASGY